MKTRTRGVVELAKLYGVETSYEGMGGEIHCADSEALALTLRALGAPLEDGRDAVAALVHRRAGLDATGMQPVQVAWDGILPQLKIRLAHGSEDSASVEFRLESGDVITQPCRAEPAALPARRGWQPTHLLRTARTLPYGYHRIVVETAGATFESLVIAAPRHAFVPAADRSWGVFFPLYALGSSRSWGTGDYTDLGRAAQWVHELGGGFVATLPLLASFLDAPFEPSPYAPASRLFWNEFFLDVTQVPGWSAGAVSDAELAVCRAGPHVDYRRIAALKRRELSRALQACAGDADVMAGLRHFAAAHAFADDYARFRAVGERHRTGWPAWPERLRNGEIRDGDFAPEDRDYHLFVQWQTDRQLGRIGADEHAAALYLDMPLGVHPDSFDMWRFRDVFAGSVSAGAPPDPLFTGGQDWGFRPLHPQALRESGYAYFIEALRQQLRHAQILRLDHVMSLYRLFWIPAGVEARRGVYVRYAEEELFAVLVLESARHRAPIIGEDLGTVPAAVRRAMKRHGIHRMHVVQYEAAPDTRPPAPLPGEMSVACLNTHDMPTFAGFWRGSDIDDQLDLGLIDAAGHAEAMNRRAALRLALSRDLGGGGQISVGVARQRLTERLAASPARFVLVALEDLWLEERPQNVPGTADERPNWQRRAQRTLDEVINDAAVRRMLNSIAERRRPAAPTHTKSNG